MPQFQNGSVLQFQIGTDASLWREIAATDPPGGPKVIFPN